MRLGYGKTSAAGWFSACLLLAIARPVLGADAPAAWAPRDAIVFVGIPSADMAIEAYKKTRTYKSLSDPALEKAIQPWKKLGENVQKLIAEKIGLESPKDLEIWPHGGVAAYLRADLGAGPDESKPYLCIVADMGEDADKARALAARVVQLSVEKGAEKRSIEAAGAAITAIRFKRAEGDETDAEDAAIDSNEVEMILEGVELDAMLLQMVSQALSVVEPPEAFAFAFAGSRLVLGSDADTVKDAMNRLGSGGDDTLASVPALRAYGKRCPGDPHGLVVLNWPVLVEGLGESADEEDRKVMQALGLEAFGPMIMSVQFAVSEELDSRMQGFLEVDTGKSGIARMLMMENIATSPPPGVSADTAMYVSLNLDPPLIMKEVLAIAERIDPDTAEEMRVAIRMPQEDGSTLDIQKDVVDKLAGPLAASLILAKPFDAEHCNLLVTLGHKSHEAMGKLAALVPPGILNRTEVMGQTVYELPMVPGFAMGFTQRVLIPAATRSGLEAYIRSEGNPGRGLAEDPAFRRLARHAAGRSCGMIYINSLVIADAQIALAEDDDIDPEAPPFDGQFADWIRWGLGAQAAAQDVDVLKASRKYQTHVLLTLISEADGLRFDAVAIPASDESNR